ncbi:MAG: galactose oxidase [Fimbriimonadaceae bacterium]|nr:galactose oxidase [Fimbriimonadaceae bacterium]
MSPLMALCALAGSLLVPQTGGETPLDWGRLPDIPDPEGFAAPFAGVSHGTLLVAGGANFPLKRPWEGGAKAWYRTVYALQSAAGKWQKVGLLPRQLAYGVSVSFGERMVCVGGSDRERHYAETFAVEFIEGGIVTTPLPALPLPVANACGALVGSRLFVAGGQESPDSTTASAQVFALDLSAKHPAWRELPPLPGDGRILATAASCQGRFWVIGGASLKPDSNGQAVRTYLRDAYAFGGRSWVRMPDLPSPSVAAPSPAPTTARGLFLLGGDDGSWAGKPARDHPGFPNTVLRYDLNRDRWLESGATPAPRVTAPVVQWRDRWVVPSGEQRPGVRSQEVWTFRIRAPKE